MSTKLTIYRVPGSHPCQAVIRGAELKGLEHKIVDLAPPMQVVVAPLLFGGRTVPAMRIHGGPDGTDKVQTTLKCLRALESLAPEPALYPADAETRARVLEAERWGVGEFQDLARRLSWAALRAKPKALFSFDSNLPLPDIALKPFVRTAIWLERRINGASSERVRRDLEVLPAYLDEIDAFIAAGTIGGAEPNAADLTVLSTVWLLRSFEDLRPVIDSRPAGRKTRELFGEAPGAVPEGAYDRAWLTAVNAARGTYVPAH
jgi:glutathione S-transferase